MCTLSVIPPSGMRGLRLVVNRDERATRQIGWPPQIVERDGARAVWPVDPESGGTWIAASSAGLVWALINMNGAAPAAPPDDPLSRGLIIPSIVGSRTIDEGASRIVRLPLARFASFRLIGVYHRTIALLAWNGRHLQASTAQLLEPCIFSSSSLGDALVEGPRRELFHQLLAIEPDPWRAQDRLHHHAWPDRRHLSVLMTRTTARTVSRTVVLTTRDATRMSYAPVVNGWVCPVMSATLVHRVSRPPAVRLQPIA